MNLYRLRISKSLGGETPMLLQSQHCFSSREAAFAQVYLFVPEDERPNWTSSDDSSDIKFDFRVDSARFQIWIDKMPIDKPITSLFLDQTITQTPEWCAKNGFHF